MCGCQKKKHKNIASNLLYLCQQYIPTCVDAEIIATIMEMTSIALKHMPPNSVPNTGMNAKWLHNHEMRGPRSSNCGCLWAKPPILRAACAPHQVLPGSPAVVSHPKIATFQPTHCGLKKSSPVWPHRGGGGQSRIPGVRTHDLCNWLGVPHRRKKFSWTWVWIHTS